MRAPDQLAELHRSPRRTLSRPRLVFFSFVSIALGLAFALATGEFAVRYAVPQALVSDLVIVDNEVDYRLRPNSVGRMSSPEYSAEIRINSLGFRGEEVSFAKTPGVRRVLFLGDSFTFGHGVAENETLPHRVGQELARAHSQRYEVINGGVYGYCTANELEFFMKYGLPVKPDVVVILVMTHDMVDNTGWYELTQDGELRRKLRTSQYIESRRITRYIPGAAWLRENSHLFKFIGMRVLPVLKSGAVKDDNTSSDRAIPSPRIDEFSPDFYRQERGAFQVTAALLQKLVQVAYGNRAQVILLTLGGKEEILGGNFSSRHLLPHEYLKQAALAVGFSDAIALSPILASYEKPKELFFPQDGHWTATAMKYVAPTIADVIAKMSNDGNQ